jgi:hypothetical protein
MQNLQAANRSRAADEAFARFMALDNSTLAYLGDIPRPCQSHPHSPWGHSSNHRALRNIIDMLLMRVPLYSNRCVETVWLWWSDLLVAGMWILCKELCSSRTNVT